MILIVGLGNPGIKYQNTRHNIGFIAVDELAKYYGFLFSEKSKFLANIANGTIEDNKLFLIKPQTFMNLSGSSVSKIKSYYNIKLEDIFIIHDDIDLAVGKIKFKLGGGNGGHNGLKSLDQCLGNNYNRIRIGVGRPGNNIEVADYVLSDFFKREHNVMQNSIKKITDNFDLLLSKKIDEFKNKIAL